MRTSYLAVDRTYIDYLIETSCPLTFSRGLDELRHWYFAWRRAIHDVTCKRQKARRLQSLAGRFRSHGLIGVGQLADALRRLLRFRDLKAEELAFFDEQVTRAITLVQLRYRYAAPCAGVASRRRPQSSLKQLVMGLRRRTRRSSDQPPRNAGSAPEPWNSAL